MTKQRTLPEVVKQYEVQLKIEQEVTNAYETQLKAIKDKRAKMEAWILAQTDELDVELSETTKELAPYISWYLRPKTDDNSVEAFRVLREQFLAMESDAKEDAKILREQGDKIKEVLLATMTERGQTSFQCATGSAERHLKTRASTADFSSLFRWAAEHGEEDMFTTALKASTVNDYFEKHGEYPPFVNVYKEYSVVVKKGRAGK